ncbi:Uncharacterised protein [Dermatophilus congolensis]|uniref:Uncharacterized protein n=1 Tax=Dermatophilus congolensis TaxID=1863 RepID=A0AA46BNR1_9MICO|nr:Uncharacterised protein [Dermatophilus congolensis]
MTWLVIADASGLSLEQVFLCLRGSIRAVVAMITGCRILAETRHVFIRS